MPSNSPRQRRASDRSADASLLRLWLWTTVGVVAGVTIIALLLWHWPEDMGERDGAPSWTPDGRHIVFSSQRNGRADLFVMNADGSERRQLTDTTAEENAPAVSFDGRSIAFETDRDGNIEIYVSDIEGRAPRRLTHDPGADRAPAWSPDGRRIVFISDRASRPNFDIYVMNADGSNLQRLTKSGANWAPEFSPTTPHLAMQVDNDIRVLDLSSGTIRLLTFAPQDGLNPTWSPDGKQLAFVTTRNRRLEIFTMNDVGGDQQLLVSMPRGAVIDPRWSPDGTRIAFVYLPSATPAEQVSEGQALYVVELASGRLTRLSP